jgi:hypothetical protein
MVTNCQFVKWQKGWLSGWGIRGMGLPRQMLAFASRLSAEEGGPGAEAHFKGQRLFRWTEPACGTQVQLPLLK